MLDSVSSLYSYFDAYAAFAYISASALEPVVRSEGRQPCRFEKSGL
jgi:hypothetical protein